MSFKAFLDAAKSIITLGAAANASARQDIRTVVGELSDALERALALTDTYLVGATFAGDDQALARYLADINGTLMGCYHEQQICGELYQLADKFEQLFDPTRFSVAVASYRDIPRLIGELKNGERVILDDLEDMVQALRAESVQLYGGTRSRAQVLAVVEHHRQQISYYRQQLKTRRRQLLAAL